MLFALAQNHVLLVLEKLGYIAFMALGFYFVYQGSVMEKYQKKRTNFAEHSEPVVELPTILIRMEYNEGTDTPLTYGAGLVTNSILFC